MDSNSIQPQPSISHDSRPVSGKQPQEEAPKARERARRNRVIHSCLECRRRKLKCDRRDPCHNCHASGEHCVYVNSAKSNAELRQKLTLVKEAKDAIDTTLRSGIDTRPLKQQSKAPAQRCKRSRLPDEMPSEDSDSSADDGFLEPTPLAVQDAAYADDADDDVEDLGFRIGRMRLGERIGGLYRPRIADEVMSSLDAFPTRGALSVPLPVIVTPDEDFAKPTPSFTAPSIGNIFSQGSSSDSLVGYIPTRRIADRLLLRYWSSVHPVARVLHRPSFAHRYETLWEEIDNGHQAAASLIALVCSVLFSAVVSMSEGQVSETCKVSRSSLKNKLKLGVEASIGRAQLLKTTKLETLQTFVVYLLSMCIDEISRAHSVLTGMVVRLAECMGLHRDPSEYGFSPTECHVRRLIWYQVCYLDLKTSEIQGPRPFIHNDGYTTQLPLDVTFQGPASSGGKQPWNDMIFSMIRFECQEMQRKCRILSNRIDQKKTSLTKALSKIETFRASMDVKYGPFLNAATPSAMQKLAHQVMKLFTSLLYMIPLHRYMNSVTYRIPDRLRQIVLNKGTDILEAAVELETSEDLKTWSWYSGAYQQYHTAFLLLVEVFTYPMRREATRIWKCLDFIFAEVLLHVPPLNAGASSPTLQDVIAHRDMKARCILTLVCQRMRAYQNAKGLKIPVQFDDSMIIVTPQKDGDNSNPHMPLNFAHGEPSAEAPAVESYVSNLPMNTEESLQVPRGPDLGTHHFSTGLSSPPDITWTTAPQNLDYMANTWASSARSISPWIENQENDASSDQNSRIHANYSHSYAPSPTTHESSRNSYSNGRHHQINDIDPKIVEIDWNLWDTMFPPQVNDGNLDYSDDSMWQSYNSFNDTVQW